MSSQWLQRVPSPQSNPELESRKQNNLLERLPMEMGQLSKMDALILDHNPELSSPPRSASSSLLLTSQYFSDTREQKDRGGEVEEEAINTQQEEVHSRQQPRALLAPEVSLESSDAPVYEFCLSKEIIRCMRSRWMLILDFTPHLSHPPGERRAIM